MKTKEQILDWLDEQPWASEFYKTVFTLRVNSSLSYNESFISKAFDWAKTKSGISVWKERDSEFRRWYDSNNKPMSWKEYCKQNPIKAGDGYIDEVSYINVIKNPHDRDEDDDVNVMPEYLCEAFLAYMKLIQLRNVWVKDCDKIGCCFRILTEKNSIVRKACMFCTRGLSFPTTAMADEFMHTFEDLLEVAKPLI